MYNNFSKPLEKDENGEYSSDLFGVSKKIEVLREVILFKEFIEENPMIALYGKWGSGKSTIINTLSNEMNINHKFVIFEAWQFENDDNLALSLLEQIIDEFSKEKGFLTKAVKTSRDLCKTFLRLGRNMVYESSLGVPGVSVGVGKAAKNAIEEYHEELAKVSLYALTEEFKNNFKKIVDAYTKKTSNNVVIVIDDLERCEPDKILNLLAQVKHFFTFSEKTLFIIPIDKEAASRAVEHRYSSVINSNDYLEKIFDFTLEIREPISIELAVDDMVNKYVGIVKEYYGNEISDKINLAQLSSDMKKMLLSIHFTYPRNLFKVFNRFLIYVKMKCKLKEFEENNERLLFELFFIILNEAYKEIYDSIIQIEQRINNVFSYPNLTYVFKRSKYQAVINIDEKDAILNQKIKFADLCNINHLKYVYDKEVIENNPRVSPTAQVILKNQMLLIFFFIDESIIDKAEGKMLKNSSKLPNHKDLNDILQLVQLFGPEREVISDFLRFVLIELSNEDRDFVTQPEFSISELLRDIDSYL